MTSFWDKLREILEIKGFVPTEVLLDPGSVGAQSRRAAESGPVTLFEAVRLATGVDWQDIEAIDLTFWNGFELRTLWREVWDDLDVVLLAITGKPTRCIPWAFERSRSLNEILQLVEKASLHSPGRILPHPQRRMNARDMVSVGRLDAAVANTLWTIRSNRELNYIDLLRSIDVRTIDNDERLLRALDSYTEDQCLDRTIGDLGDLVPRQLVRVKQAGVETDRTDTTFAGFIKRMFTSLPTSVVSDSDLLRHLITVAPEMSSKVRILLQRQLTSA